MVLLRKYTEHIFWIESSRNTSRQLSLSGNLLTPLSKSEASIWWSDQWAVLMSPLASLSLSPGMAVSSSLSSSRPRLCWASLLVSSFHSTLGERWWPKIWDGRESWEQSNHEKTKQKALHFNPYCVLMLLKHCPPTQKKLGPRGRRFILYIDSMA